MFDEFRYKYDYPNDEYKKILTTNDRAVKREVLSRYLTSAIRVSKEIFPEIYTSIESVLKNLNIKDSLDFFITPNSVPNAVCIRVDIKSSVIIINSGMIELLSFDELSFIIGHEIGHHIFDHCSEKINFNSSDNIIEILLDKSRKMELSCDRAGLLAVKDFDISANAILKIVSGLGSNYVINDSQIYLEQLQELKKIGIKDEKNQTHHSWLIRMHALKMFSKSSEYNRFIGNDNKGDSLNKIDKIIETYLNDLTGVDVNKKELEVYELALLFILPKYLYDNLPFDEIKRNTFITRFGENKTNQISKYLANSSDDQYNKKYKEHMQNLNSTNKSLRIRFHEEVANLVKLSNEDLPSNQSRLLEIELGL